MGTVLLVAAFGALLLAATVPGPASTAAPAVPDRGAPAAAPYPGTYAFVDVHVVPMDRWRVLEHQTVLVRDGEIREVGDTGSVALPDDATRIAGEGRYLLPGLGDMHVRLPGPNAPEQWLEDALFLYVANGVTVIRQGEGRSGHRSLKRRLLGEQQLGPTLYTASPTLDVDSTATAAAVEAAVRAVAGQRWDHLRTPDAVNRATWDRIAEASIGIGLPFGGPVPPGVGLRHAIATDVSTVDHLDGFLEAAVADELRARRQAADSATDRGEAEAENGGPPELPDLATLVREVDPQNIRAVVGRARAGGVWVTPMLRLWETLYRPGRPDSLLEQPEMGFVPREVRGRWITEKEGAPAIDAATARRLAAARRAVVKELNDGAGGVLLATGSPGMFNVPGFSIHREIGLMEEAGLTPYEVLVSGTRNVARYASGVLGESGRFGTIAAGNRADLILVDGDPLEELQVLERPEGVMVRGRWLPAEEIEERLERIAARRGG